jgi:hypothetical protein
MGAGIRLDSDDRPLRQAPVNDGFFHRLRDLAYAESRASHGCRRAEPPTFVRPGELQSVAWKKFDLTNAYKYAAGVIQSPMGY